MNRIWANGRCVFTQGMDQVHTSTLCNLVRGEFRNVVNSLACLRCVLVDSYLPLALILTTSLARVIRDAYLLARSVTSGRHVVDAIEFSQPAMMVRRKRFHSTFPVVTLSALRRVRVVVAFARCSTRPAAGRQRLPSEPLGEFASRGLCRFLMRTPPVRAGLPVRSLVV